MRNQNLPPIKYREGPQARPSEVQIKYWNEAVVEEKMVQAALDELAESEMRREMREDAQPGSRMTFVPKEKRDAALYGPGLKARTIGPDEEL